MSAISNILHTISDHGNVIASKTITSVGLVSVGGGGVIGVANGTAEKVAQAQAFGVTDWAAVVSIVGGISFIVKNVVDSYLNIQANKRADELQRQQIAIDAANQYMDEERRNDDRRKID